MFHVYIDILHNLFKISQLCFFFNKYGSFYSKIKRKFCKLNKQIPGSQNINISSVPDVDYRIPRHLTKHSSIN